MRLRKLAWYVSLPLTLLLSSPLPFTSPLSSLSSYPVPSPSPPRQWKGRPAAGGVSPPSLPSRSSRRGEWEAGGRRERADSVGRSAERRPGGGAAGGGSPPSLPSRSGRRGVGGSRRPAASHAGRREAAGGGSPPSLPPRSGRRGEGSDGALHREQRRRRRRPLPPRVAAAAASMASPGGSDGDGGVGGFTQLIWRRRRLPTARLNFFHGISVFVF